MGGGALIVAEGREEGGALIVADGRADNTLQMILRVTVLFFADTINFLLHLICQSKLLTLLPSLSG